MDTIIITTNGVEITIPHADWHTDGYDFFITDEIEHSLIIGRFSKPKVAGIYSTSQKRLKTYI